MELDKTALHPKRRHMNSRVYKPKRSSLVKRKIEIGKNQGEK